MVRRCDVAIVGGGIGGLTLAASLLRQSVSVQIFEQDTELREIGAGVAIGGNATRLLGILGIDLASAANMPPALEFRCWKDGRLLWSHPIGEWYRQEVGAPYLTLHRGTLQRLLAAAVTPECIQLNHRLTGLSDEPAGVRLHFENGDDVVATVVAGADGVHSTARRYVCGDVPPTHSGEIGFRGVIPVGKSQALPNPTSVHCWCGPGTHVIYYGLDRGELVNLLAVYRPDRLPAWTALSDRVPATTDQALSIFEEYSWDRRILDLVRSIEGDMSFWALVELPRLPRWSRGRVMLLGDAAHAPLPHQGQGAGLAIEDAYALGALLAKGGLKDYDWAFQAFENLRKRRAWMVQAYSRAAGRAYKFLGDAAATRDARWPSLPQRIGWIHRYRLEEIVPTPSPSGAISRQVPGLARSGRPGPAARWCGTAGSIRSATGAIPGQDPDIVYALGSSPGESARLQRQADELAADSAALLDRVGLRPGHSAIDLGCGPRGVLDLLAERVSPAGRVVGLDADPAHTAMAAQFAASGGLSCVEVMTADARNTGLAPGSFDLVHARTLLVNLPDPAGVAAEMTRLARPGGWVASMEPDTECARCYPPHPAFDRLCEIFTMVFRRNGADPWIGRKVPGLLRQAGLDDVQVEARAQMYPRGNSRRTIRLDLVRSMRSQVLKMGLASVAELDELDTAARAHLEDPHTVVIQGLLFLTWGRKPDHAPE